MTSKEAFEHFCEDCPKIGEVKLRQNIMLGVVTVIGVPFFGWLALTVWDISKKVEVTHESIPKVEARIHEIEDRERTNAITINRAYKNIEDMIRGLKNSK